ncbi:MAG: hypothetical protein EOP84_02685 [Verrucomicrobiaceae bacterium]|nr:MAG: hypothetical protein EOP84_02685 [Verrucomicrobiaceae bacterium]
MRLPDLTRYELFYPALSLLGAGLILFGIVVVFLRLERSSARTVSAGLVSLIVGAIAVSATMEHTRKSLPSIPDLTKVRR